jgi:hypothetical protein
MSAYVVGNLIGRLLISYTIVLLAMLVGSTTDWRRALRRTHRWYGAAGVIAVFSVGLAVAMT